MANQPGRDQPFQFRLPWARQPMRRLPFQPTPHRPSHSTPSHPEIEPRTPLEIPPPKPLQPPTAPEQQRSTPSTQRVPQASSPSPSQNPPALSAPQPPRDSTQGSTPIRSETNRKRPPPTSSKPPSSLPEPKSLASQKTTQQQPPMAPSTTPQPDSIQPPLPPSSAPQADSIQPRQLSTLASTPPSQFPSGAPVQPPLSREEVTQPPLQAPPSTSQPESILSSQIKSSEPQPSHPKPRSEFMPSGEEKPSTLKASTPNDRLQTTSHSEPSQKPERVIQPSESSHPKPTPIPTEISPRLTEVITASELQKPKAGTTDVTDKFATAAENELSRPVQTTPGADEKPKQDVEEKQGTGTQTKSRDEVGSTLIKESNEKVKPQQRGLPDVEPKKTNSIHGASSKSSTSSSESSSESDGTVSETKPRPPPTLPNKRKEGKKNSSNQHERSNAISAIHQDETQHGDRGAFQKELKGGIAKLVQKLNFGQAHQPDHGNAVTIITLAGENRGASMRIIYDRTDKGKASNVPTSSKIGKDKLDTTKIATTERSPKQIDGHITLGDHLIPANVNSNVQSINNSLLQESACNERDPGVKMNFCHKPLEPINMEKKDLYGAFRTTPTANPAQKSTYEPHIRRRCLRGLLMESGEDDQENPQKPRRHGCRFNCDEKKDGKTGQGFSAENSNVKN